MSEATGGVVRAAGSAGWLTPPRLVMAMYFFQATAVNNWFPRIPDVQTHLGLSPAELAIALLGMPIGGLIGTAMAATLIEKITARRALGYGFIAFALVALLPGFATNLPTLFAILFAMGITYTVNDVAANVEAARIQDVLGRRIMSTCHGFWSLGSVVGLTLGSAFADWQIDTRWHLIAVMAVVTPLALVTALQLPQFAVEPRDERMRPPFLSLPTVAMLGLCIYAFGSIVGELTTRNWGAVYLRDGIGATAAQAGIGYAAFSVVMTIGRFVGDRLIDRFGPEFIGRLCAILAALGIAAIVATNYFPLAVVGFGLVGAGISVAMPLAVTTAAGLGGGRSPAVNVAALSLIAYTGSLIGPPLVGFVADAYGLRAGFAAILPLVLLSIVFASSLRPRAR